MNLEIFLSYCWAQRDVADIIDTKLRSVGVRIIRDTRFLKPFGDLERFMIDSIASADYVVPLLSPEYQRSQNCMAELILALGKSPDVVLPVRLVEHCKLNSDIAWQNLSEFWKRESCKKAEIGKIEGPHAEFPTATRIAQALPNIRTFFTKILIPSFEELRAAGYASLLSRFGFDRSQLVSELLRIETADDPEEQEICFDRFLRKYPDHSLAHHIRALAQKKRSDFRRAKESYETSISLEPSFPDAHNDYALLMENQFQEMEVAETHYLRAIELDQSFDLALNNYGSFLKSAGRFEESEKFLRRAIAVNKSYTGARMNLATLLAEYLNDAEQARDELEIVLGIDDLYADAHANYAVLMRDYFGQQDVARQHWARSVSLKRSEGHQDRGWQADKGKRNEADN